MKTRHDDNTVVLSWTAPGDDFDHNTASRYEITMASTAANLLGKLTTSRYITQDDVTHGNLESPLPAGSIEMFTLKMKRGPNFNASFVFTIRAIDDAGHKGDFSNFATAGFGFIPDYVDPEFSENVPTSGNNGSHSVGQTKSHYCGSGGVVYRTARDCDSYLPCFTRVFSQTNGHAK
ncbi:calcium-activated chloride channel regulator 1-like [Gigantopelta aegis]|uniref:calcium-activated chloride channel regulator 1-like n=1 Tax=Gigantopelta aegis TaxID=1735272 RepID=UPI001B88DB2D|nr:calcium-activated chloride channel regulator 1-like [Gigantopelta aegis]